MPNTEYVKGQPKDFDEIVDLLNYVFSHDIERHDFPTLFPILYNKETDTTGYHYLAKQNGKIVALVGCYPTELTVLGETLSVARIGNVAVHPYHRGEGHMKALMNLAIEGMEESGAAFGVLSGQRQRYEYFGFEQTGTSIDMAITATNLRHTFPGRTSVHITLAPMQKDGPMTLAAYTLQRSKPVYCAKRAEDFYTACRSWDSRPLYILRDGEFCGYLVCSADGKRIREIELNDIVMLSDVLIAYFAFFSTATVSLELAPYETEKLAILLKYCEGASVTALKSVRFIDLEQSIRQFLRLKATCGNLCDGRIILDIIEYGRLSLYVNGQKTDVSPSSEPADLTLSKSEAVQLLFSPLVPFYQSAQLPQALCGPAASWFPLPIWIPSLDRL